MPDLTLTIRGRCGSAAHGGIVRRDRLPILLVGDAVGLRRRRRLIADWPRGQAGTRRLAVEGRDLFLGARAEAGEQAPQVAEFRGAPGPAIVAHIGGRATALAGAGGAGGAGRIELARGEVALFPVRIIAAVVGRPLL